MTALRAYGGDKSGIWQERVERARRYAKEVRERADHAVRTQSKQRLLKLAKRYERMANLTEKQVKNHGY
jgi:hypothetical protein